MKTLVVVFLMMLVCAEGLVAQDTIKVDNKKTPHDTLEPFDQSKNKHIEVPNPSRPPANPTPPPPKRNREASERKK